jgi:hypothetical protein
MRGVLRARWSLAGTGALARHSAALIPVQRALARLHAVAEDVAVAHGARRDRLAQLDPERERPRG